MDWLIRNFKNLSKRWYFVLDKNKLKFNNYFIVTLPSLPEWLQGKKKKNTKKYLFPSWGYKSLSMAQAVEWQTTLTGYSVRLQAHSDLSHFTEVCLYMAWLLSVYALSLLQRVSCIIINTKNSACNSPKK